METLDERPMRLVYARYQGTGTLTADLARQLPAVMAELQSARQETGKYAWAMADVGERTVDGEKLLFGRFGKTARDGAGPGSDGSTPSAGRKAKPGKKAVCSNFFIHPASSIIALEDKPLLPAGKFLKRFKQFLEKRQTGEIGFEFLKNEPEIFAILKSWDKISAAKFDLASSHTRLREDFAPLNEIIKKSKARRVSFKFEGGDDGIDTGNSIIQQGVSMAAAGYGEFNLKGVAEDARTGLNSKSCLIATGLLAVDDLASLAPVVLAGIRKILMPINHPESNSGAEPAGAKT
jgi:hypothetical protein